MHHEDRPEEFFLPQCCETVNDEEGCLSSVEVGVRAEEWREVVQYEGAGIRIVVQ